MQNSIENEDDEKISKMAYKLLNIYHDKNVNLTDKNYELNYVSELNKKIISKQKLKIKKLQQELNDILNESEQQKQLISQKCKSLSLSEFFKGYYYQISDNRKKEIEEKYTNYENEH